MNRASFPCHSKLMCSYLALLLLLLLQFGPVHGTVHMDSDVWKALHTLSSVRVAVSLHTTHDTPSEIHEAQQAVLSQLHGVVQVKKFFKKYPLMSLVVDSNAVHELATLHRMVDQVDLDQDLAGHGSGSLRGHAMDAPVQEPIHQRRARIQREHRYMLDYSVPLIGADDRHALGNKGAGITVAVLDTGCDSDHPDLMGRGSFVHKYDACFGDPDYDGRHVLDQEGFCPNGSDRQSGNGSGEDDNGHGTTVTGIITSNGQAHLAPPGVAPDANIITLKVLDAKNRFFVPSEIVDALEYLVDLLEQDPQAVDIINLSLGTGHVFEGTCDSQKFYQKWSFAAIQTMREQYNVTTLAAAGNNGQDGLNWPACMTNVIAVGSTDANDVAYRTSNHGHELDIFAPGVGIQTTAMGGKQQRWTGTSHACPHAAGCAALLMSSGDAVTPAQVEARLKLSEVMVTQGTTTAPRINCKPNPSARCHTTAVLANCHQTPSSSELQAVMDRGSTGEPIEWTFAPHSNLQPGPNTVTMTVKDILGLTDTCNTTVTVQDCDNTRKKGGGGDDTETSDHGTTTTSATTPTSSRPNRNVCPQLVKASQCFRNHSCLWKRGKCFSRVST